jgi:hypothetical protein
MIIIVLGQQGSGKTLFLAREGFKAYQQGMTVYSNFDLKYPHKILTFDDMLQCQLSNAIVILDEAALWGLGSRDFGSKKNKIITGQFLVQCRKQGVCLYCSSQWIGLLEIRIRQLCDYVIHCKKYLLDTATKTTHEAIQSKNYRRDIPIIIECEWNDIAQDKVAYQYFYANDLYRLYDTREVIHMQEIPTEDRQKTKKT